MSTLEDIAKETAALQQTLEHVGQMLKDAGRSAVIEVSNGTSRAIPSRINGSGHNHGGFSQLPAAAIDSMKSDVFGSRSSENSLAGTSGSVFYALDGEDTMLHVHWEIPEFGDNEASSNVAGPHADWYAHRADYGAGSKKVPVRFVVTEKAMLAPGDPDWRTCQDCKALFHSLDGGKCPKRIEFIDAPVVVADDLRLAHPGHADHVAVAGAKTRILPHRAAGYVFALPSAPGPSREPGWRQCGRCKSLFYDGWDSKGACPKWDQPRPGHVAEAGGREYILPFNVPARATQQDNWRFCTKCYVLFYLPHNADSACAAGGLHHAHENNYVLDRIRDG
jgi:hypothetical protein